MKWVMVLSAGFSIAGCFSTTEVSSVGPFVHAIRAEGPTLLIEGCEINHVETTDYDFCTPMLLPYRSSSTTRTALTQTNCVTSTVPTIAAP